MHHESPIHYFSKLQRVQITGGHVPGALSLQWKNTFAWCSSRTQWQSTLFPSEYQILSPLKEILKSKAEEVSISSLGDLLQARGDKTGLDGQMVRG